MKSSGVSLSEFLKLEMVLKTVLNCLRPCVVS